MPISGSKIRPILESAVEQNKLLFSKTEEALVSLFPIETTRYRISIKNIRPGKPLSVDYTGLKDALLKKSSITVPVLADLALSTLDGKKIEEGKGIRVLSMPIMTTLRTFVLDGTQYATTNQLRLRPGVYTKRANSGEIVSFFNFGKGQNFRLRLEPSTGVFYVMIGTTKNIALYPLLSYFGLSDSEIGNVWGQSLLEANRKITAGKGDKALQAFYDKFLFSSEKKPGANSEEKAKSLVEAFKTRTTLDRETTQTTLGKGYDTLDVRAILDATRKILGVFQEKIEEDERDSLEFKKLVTIDDFFREAMIKERGKAVVNKIKSRLNKTSGIPSLKNVFPNGVFTSPITNFITTESITGNPEQINPVEILDQSHKVTSLGPGGIPSVQSISKIQRLVHPSHLGVIDPIRTPENEKAGIDLRLAPLAGKDENGKLYSPFVNAKTRKSEYMDAGEAKTKFIAFEDPRGKSELEILHNGEIKRMAARKATHFLQATEFMFGTSTNLLPFLGNMQGNRAIMGSKQVAQALPLVNAEAPLIQTLNRVHDRSQERIVGEMISRRSPISGLITKVNKNAVYVKGADNKTKVIPLQNKLPLNSKTFLHDEPIVKKGDKVKAGQILAENNYTRNGTLALGTNLNVAYMPYHGLVHEDSVIISESGAKKLTSAHMYRKSIDIKRGVVLNKSKFRTFYPNLYAAESYEKLDESGIIKKGETVEYGEPIILALRKTEATSTDILLGRLHRSFNNPYKDSTITWDKMSPGEIIDVKVTRSSVVVTVETHIAATEGDKVGGRHGNKGVIAQVIPNDQMPRNENGDFAEMIMTPLGIISRINPSQILETAVAKVAFKTGEPIVIDNFDGQDKIKWAKSLLKKHGIKDKEDLFDPTTGKTVKQVMFGKQNVLKLHKTVDTNFSARSTGGYDVNQQPLKGGIEGSKGLGMMEVNALLAHNARNNLREFATIKSQKNDEYWTSVRAGLPLPSPAENFAFNKFTGMLKGMNVKVDKNGSFFNFAPMTDKDVMKLSNGPVKNAKQVRSKDLLPEQGGIFDFGLTGGVAGNKWSHIDLDEPMVNPIFETSVQKLLGYQRKSDFQKELVEKGGGWFKKELSKIDIDKREQELMEEIPKLKDSKLSNSVKQLKYIQALKANNMKPEDAYVISKVPVIPPNMRPIQVNQSTGSLMTSGPNFLYRDLILFNETLKDVKKSGLPDRDVQKARASMANSLSALQGITSPNSPQLQNKGVQGFLGVISGGEGRQPKEGFVQSVLLSRNADFTGRGTASPDPSLNIDQIGLPEDQAWTMYEPFVMRRITRLGYKSLEAKDHVERRTILAQKALQEELKQRPVLVNRAPTLWKTNIMAAYPKLVPGKVLKIQPLMEEGMNLDYDGDALTLHVPVEPGSVLEAKKMTLRTNFFSDKTKDNLLVQPSQEPVIGLWKASQPPTKKATKKFKDIDKAWQAYLSGTLELNDPIDI